MRELMLNGNYPGIATHDPAMINEAKRWAKEQGIAKDRFEFQMLYGVRRDLQQSLVKEGYRMRVYVPVRRAVVPLSHAPPRGASRERGLHHGQRPSRSAPAPTLTRRSACPGSISPPITAVATPTPSAATRRCTVVRPPSKGRMGSPTASRS
jgi:hypothetical protein